MSEGKQTPEELKALGNKAFEAKDYPKAIQYYTEAIALEPSNHVFFSNRSASHAGLDEWEKAAADAKECIRLDPSFVKGYYRLATARMEMAASGSNNDSSSSLDAALATVRQGLSMEANHPQLIKLQRSIQQKMAAALSSSAASSSSSLQQAPMGGASAANLAALDDATKRELQDLQGMHAQTMQEYNVVETNLVKTQREHRIQELTTKELDELVPMDSSDKANQAKCYRSIGKLFLRTDREKVAEHLNKKIDDLKKQETDLTQKMEYLQRRITSQRQNMQELIAKAE